MTSELPETVTIHKTILSRIHDGAISAHSYVNDRDHWTVQFGLSDSTGQRGLDAIEGDAFEFVGARWKVLKVYEPTAATRGAVAELTRVSEQAD